MYDEFDLGGEGVVEGGVLGQAADDGAVVLLADREDQPRDGDPHAAGAGGRGGPAVLLRVPGRQLPVVHEPSDGGGRVAPAHHALQLHLLAGRGHHRAGGAAAGDDHADADAVADALDVDAGRFFWNRMVRY